MPERIPEAEGGRLLANLVRFGRLLRGLGIATTPDRIASLATALEGVDLSRRDEVKNVARSLFVYRREQLEVFDRAFDAFFRRGGSPRPPGAERFRRPRPGRIQALVPVRDPGDQRPEMEVEELVEERHYTYSASEALARKDFAELTDFERREVLRLMRSRVLTLAARRTRRRVRARTGPYADLRRTMRRGLRYGGEPLELFWRARKEKPRPLVVLCDISGSMETYSRLLLELVYVIAKTSERVEAFVFATRLTRITRQLAHRRVDDALARAAEKVSDWGGGTRIGEAVKRFNHDWARRLLGQGAVLLLISDGWDRGDPEELGREMARLRRSCQRLVWLNPLLGSPGYEPLTRGMRAALDHVDDFLPVHNLESLEQLGRLLGRLEERPRPTSTRRILHSA